MRAGRVSFARAVTLTEKTAHLDAFTAAAIATRVLRPLAGPDGAPLPGVGLSQATFNARLHRQLVLHHGLVGQAERTYEEALKGRGVRAQPSPDGTGALVITGDGPRITAAAARVDKIARRLRKNGDPRTLAQLRADVATDLLLAGWIPTDPTFANLGKPPAALVHLIVSLPTMLGADQGIGLIPGWGAISAQQARELALQAGSIWKRVVTDPLTGRAIEVSAGTYQVPAAMAEQVNARDGTCRAPGCEVPAEHCDHDHSHEWEPEDAGGPTAETNLAALHRGHHNLKTAGFLGQRPVTRRHPAMDHRDRADREDPPLRLRPPRQPAGRHLTAGGAPGSAAGPGAQPRHPSARTPQHPRPDRLVTRSGPGHPPTPAAYLGHRTSQPRPARSSGSRSRHRRGATTVLRQLIRAASELRAAG